MDMLLDFFNGDGLKVSLWLNTQNGNLGGLSPKALFQLGKGDKVEKFIRNAIEENKDPRVLE
jgi:hypothetical protein